MIEGAERIVELTVTADYLNWAPEESVRDLIQNAIDAQAKGFAFTWHYDEGILTLKNKGALIPWKAMLIGYSTKRGDDTQIGMYGEGLKLSLLCLTRAGYKIRVNNGTEVWLPMIEHSETFDESVLKFKVLNLMQPIDGVELVVEDLPQDVWDKCRSLFLKLEDDAVNIPFEADGTEILSESERRGFIYVGGIQVARVTDPPLQFGYNFPPKSIPVDRDRRMVCSNDLIGRTTKLWMTLAQESDEAFDEFVRLIGLDAPDTREVRWSWNIPDALAAKVVTRFFTLHGTDAYPVRVSESHEASILENTAAAKPVFVSDSYVYVLRKALGDVKTMVEKAKTDACEVVDPLRLTSQERDCLYTCWTMTLDSLNDSDFKSKSRVEVVKFQESDIEGTFKNNDDGTYRVRINRNCLVSPGRTMATLIHECSHRKGYHQEAAFLSSTENAWSNCFSVLWETLARRG